MNAPIMNEAVHYNALKEKLLSSHIDIDDETLADTLEGITNLKELIAFTLRRARESDARADALQELITKMADRKTRLQHRALIDRGLVKRAMEVAEIDKEEYPDMTVSIGQCPDRVIITDEKEIPPDLLRIKKEPDKKAIKVRLKRGGYVPGAILSNGGTRLNVRTT